MVEKKRALWFAAAVAVVILSGCRGPHFGDAQGWSDSQEEEFVRILRNDKYVSLCGLESLYAEYRRTKDTRILSKILVNYVDNLANSCIDIDAYKKIEKERNAKKIHTHFEFYTQNASASGTISALRDGSTIEEILAPYIPKNPMFARLLRRYHSGGLSPEQRRKVRMSLERTKVMSDEGWDIAHVLVNVPEFRLRFFDENMTLAMSFPVITGKKSWQTPLFSAKMKYVVLNPAWNVPDNIARREEIPRLLRNPDYFKRNNMVVRRSYDVDSKPVDPRTVDWKKYLGPEYKKKELPYKLIQRASGRNALGRVKFMFPNPYSVYMHDTPTKRLFKRSYRAFSHGCIRLSKPLEMLEYMAQAGYLRDDPETVQEKLQSGKRKYVSLSTPVYVHVAYLTAYVAEDGSVKFFKDVYGLDTLMPLKKGID